MARQKGQQVLIKEDDEEDYLMPGDGRKIVEDDATKKDGLDSLSLGAATRRLRLQVHDGFEFGGKIRLDYFPVTPFDVFGDDISDISNIDSDGGGGGSNGTQKVSLGISLNNDNSDNSIRGDAGEADGSNISRPVPVEVFATKVRIRREPPPSFQNTAPRRIRLQRLQRKVLCKNDDGNDTGSDYEECLEFGRDTNRLDYFPVTPFDVVYGDDDIGDIAIYGGGGGTNRTQQGSLGISLSNDNSDSSIRGDAGEADGSIISRQVPVEVFANNGGSDQVPVQGLDQESSIGGSEKFIGGVEGAGFVVQQWWEKCWLFLALWKTI